MIIVSPRRRVAASPCRRVATAYTGLVGFTWRLVPYLLRRSLIAAFDDGCFGIAKAAAYSALLSFFPVLTTAATILVQTHAQFVANNIQKFLSEIVPPGTENIVVQQFQVRGQRPLFVLVFAILLSLWAASGVIKSLIEGFQAAYRVPRSRSFLRQTGVAVALVLLAAVPLVGASLLILFGGQVERQVLNWLKVDPLFTPLAGLWEWISRIMRYAVALGTTTIVTITLYYFGPYRPQRWRDVWLTSIGYTIAGGTSEILRNVIAERLLGLPRDPRG